MTDETRSIELEVDVVGTPEEVWRAIATGPGISSWYVPHDVEEREGGAANASFGPDPGMQVAGRVAVWDPPHRIVFDGGDPDEGLAFEWMIEAREGGTCVVRLVNSGFVKGEEWDDMFDGMRDGWQLFLANLQLHLAHFGGQTATAMLPMANWPGPADRAWERLLALLGVSESVGVGQRIEAVASDDLALGGTVVEVGEQRIALLVDHPAPGTAFIAVEGRGPEVSVSVWAYLYGETGAAVVKRSDPEWRSWLEAASTTS